jgi:uncharacterized membrane protein YvlD (DUF360 family)
MEILPSFIVTLLILVVINVLITTLVHLGVEPYRLHFNILIILYLGFKLEWPFIAVLVWFVQYFHALFTVEGWEMGTIAGVITCVITSYLKDMIHLTSMGMTVFITQMFQLLWFAIISIGLYIQTHNSDLVFGRFGRFLLLSIIISLISPFFFTLLDRVWKMDEHGMIGDEI